jgi:hypothetical protein
MELRRKAAQLENTAARAWNRNKQAEAQQLLQQAHEAECEALEWDERDKARSENLLRRLLNKVLNKPRRDKVKRD